MGLPRSRAAHTQPPAACRLPFVQRQQMTCSVWRAGQCSHQAALQKLLPCVCERAQRSYVRSSQHLDLAAWPGQSMTCSWHRGSAPAAAGQPGEICQGLGRSSVESTADSNVLRALQLGLLRAGRLPGWVMYQHMRLTASFCRQEHPAI